MRFPPDRTLVPFDPRPLTPRAVSKDSLDIAAGEAGLDVWEGLGR